MKRIHIALAGAAAAAAVVVSTIPQLAATSQPAASSEPPTSDRPPAARPSFPAAAKHLTHGEGIWGVYLAITRDPNDPAHRVARRQLVAAGYSGAGGDHPAGELGCDGDAAHNLVQAGFHLESGVIYHATAIYFDTERDAFAFVDAFEPGVIGAVHATIYCAD